MVMPVSLAVCSHPLYALAVTEIVQNRGHGIVFCRWSGSLCTPLRWQSGGDMNVPLDAGRDSFMGVMKPCMSS